MAENAGAGSNICSAVQNAFNNLTNGQNDLGALTNVLTQAGLDAGAIKSLIGLVSSAADPLAVASCACQLDQGIGQLGGDIVACIQGALCDLDAAIGSPCHCSPPPPMLANCFPPVGTCTDYSTSDPAKNPACQNAIYGKLNDPSAVPVTVTPEANGTLVTYGTDENCAGDMYCFCPSPMTVVAETNYYADGGNTNNGYVMYACECPQTPVPTKAAGTSGGLEHVCLCPNGQVAVPPVKSVTNPEGTDCPTPLTGTPCASGQINIGGKCVTPCSNPSEGMTADGACCDPNQMSSCGMCCPLGTTPDPATGSCIPPQTIQ
ncbi:MAG: hypothetical protein ACRECA_09205 [Pseudolabrys sp.]